MKKILVTGAGGSPAVNFTRSLRAAPEKIHLVGTDSNKYYLQRAETDQKFLIPEAHDPTYIPILNQIIQETNCQFIHVQNDTEMSVISEKREQLNCKTFLPSKETVRICLDKFESYKRWQAHGIKQPQTMMIKDENDLHLAFEKYGNKIWIRDTTGAGGRGSLAAEDYKTAKAWLDFKKGCGSYTAAECLRPDSVTWMSIWHQGKLIVAQGRKRLYWELGKVSPSGISGATGTGVTYSDPKLDKIAQATVLAIDPNPQGIFSVDLTYDNNGIPNPTEINIGRFFATHEFFTQAGLNMPYILLKIAMDNEIPEFEKKINPLKDNIAWIRGMDFKPILTTVYEIESHVKLLEERKKNVK